MKKRHNFIEIFFLIIATCFAFASSYYLSGGTTNEGLFPGLYYFKHASLILLATIGLLSFLLKKKRTISIIYIFIIPYIIYLGINYGIIFLQFLFFLMAVSVLSHTYNSDNFISDFVIKHYFLIILIVPAVDIIFNNSNFIINTYYGRERLLLGYFHPKEAGIMFLVFFIMILFGNKIKNNLEKLFFILAAVILLYLIQSRNALLFFINLILLNTLIRYFGLKFSLIIYGCIYIILPILIINIYFDEVDILLSNRLSIWLQGNEFSLLGRFMDISIQSNAELPKYKFHIDNFYLEFIIEAGLIAFIFLILCLFYIGYKIRYVKINGYRIISFYISFLIYCFFDAGMFSSGNFLNVFVWSVVIFALRNTKTSLHASNI